MMAQSSTIARPAGGDAVSISLEGRITAYTAAPVWKDALDTLARHPDLRIVVDAPDVVAPLHTLYRALVERAGESVSRLPGDKAA